MEVLFLFLPKTNFFLFLFYGHSPEYTSPKHGSPFFQTKMRLLLQLLASQALADPHFPRVFDDPHLEDPHLQRARREAEQSEGPKEQIGEEDEAFWRSKGDAELEKALKMTPNTGVAKNIIIFIGRRISQIDDHARMGNQLKHLKGSLELPDHI